MPPILITAIDISLLRKLWIRTVFCFHWNTHITSTDCIRELRQRRDRGRRDKYEASPNNVCSQCISIHWPNPKGRDRPHSEDYKSVWCGQTSPLECKRRRGMQVLPLCKTAETSELLVPSSVPWTRLIYNMEPHTIYLACVKSIFYFLDSSLLSSVPLQFWPRCPGQVL
jgi:hypothetical protein